MRILHILPSYLPAVRYGGPIFAVHSLCQALARRGHQVEVFTTNVDGTSDSSVPIGVPVNLDGVQVRYFRSQFLRRIFLAPALGHALRSDIKQFDAVHLHSVFLWPTWAGAQAAASGGIPYIMSPRGMLVRDLLRRRSWLAKSIWIKLIERRNAEHAAAIHLTSQLEAAELERFGWRLRRLVVIGNGIEPPLPCTSESVGADVRAITGQAPVTLFFGRLSWKKGIDRLIEAFARTRVGMLAIVGTDDEELTPRLVKLAQALRIANRVAFLPRTVTGSEKEHVFAAARVFVLASYSENFGNTVLEAMRRGIPVIVTPEVGAAEIVLESGGGFVVNGDAESLGAAICRLTEDAALARSIGNAGERYVATYCTWAEIAARMERLYEQVRVRH